MITLAEGWGAALGEPDAWSGEHLGFPVYARRNNMGAWCGYIGCPAGHPWVGMCCDEVITHGGVSYAQEEAPTGLGVGFDCAHYGDFVLGLVLGGSSAWYVGFDCAHYGDFVPGLVPAEPGVDPLATATRIHVTDGFAVYRTLEYVQAELRGLAEQAARAAQG